MLSISNVDCSSWLKKIVQYFVVYYFQKKLLFYLQDHDSSNVDLNFGLNEKFVAQINAVPEGSQVLDRFLDVVAELPRKNFCKLLLVFIFQKVEVV